MPMIALDEVSKIYRVGEVDTPVLKGVTFGISAGEFVALMGPSGSGKTTLMNILGGLDQPSSGKYLLEGVDVAGLSSDKRALLRNRKFGFVFQNFNLLPRASAVENVMMPLTYSLPAIPMRVALRLSTELLERVGLKDRTHHTPSQLSGGEQQRVAIARALIHRPSILFADEPTGNLDSRTSREILDIFRMLNVEEGLTVILVTHDETVAGYAGRVLRIQDGIVESDAAAPAAPVHQLKPHPEMAPGKSSGLGSVIARGRGLLGAALAGLRRNILRATLTTLGIVIGVAAVIAMMEIGRGSSSAIAQSIASMGANNILVYPASAAFGASTAMTLTPQDGEAITKECRTVRAVAPVVRTRGQVIHGNRNWVPGSIYGTTPEYLDVREWQLTAGQPFTKREVRNGSKVCILGQTLVRELFGGEPPVGREVRINNVPFRVIGTLAAKGASMLGADQDDVLLAPWTTVKFRVSSSAQGGGAVSGQDASQTVNTLGKIYPGGQGFYPIPSAIQAANTPKPIRFTNVDQLLAAARSAGAINTAVDQITRLLRFRHRIRTGVQDDFYVRDMTEISRTYSSTSATMTNLLLVVALVSLAVGGVGIMNIMIVSVTERTREIGLRMAVGARRSAILRQFLAEAIILCFLGGFAGILVGRGVSCLARALLQWPTELSADAIVAAFAISAAVGVGFGFYPAWKASRLNPITALRYE